jgi:hypothetical protein
LKKNGMQIGEEGIEKFLMNGYGIRKEFSFENT